MPQRRTRMGDRPSLTREAIGEAAERLADSGGLDAVTLRAVAAAFETGQASLYRHIAGRDDLLTLLAERLAAGYPTVDDAAASPADVVLRQWAALHDHLAARPWAAPLIADGTHLAHSAEQMSRTLTGQLRNAGVADTDLARAYRAAWHLLLGHLLSAHPFGHADSDSQPGVAAGATDASAALDEDQDPEFSWAFGRFLAGVTSRRRDDPSRGRWQ